MSSSPSSSSPPRGQKEEAAVADVTMSRPAQHHEQHAPPPSSSTAATSAPPVNRDIAQELEGATRSDSAADASAAAVGGGGGDPGAGVIDSSSTTVVPTLVVPPLSDFDSGSGAGRITEQVQTGALPSGGGEGTTTTSSSSSSSNISATASILGGSNVHIKPPVAIPTAATAAQGQEHATTRRGEGEGITLATAVPPPISVSAEEASMKEAEAHKEEEEEEDDDDDFVRIEPEMHRGHVEVKVVMEGWLQKQCFRVVDGHPTIWRHFALWKRRYFVLGSDGCLRYYKDAELQRFRRAIPLAGMEVTAHFYAPSEGGGGGGGGGTHTQEDHDAAAVGALSPGGSTTGGIEKKGGRCLIIRPKQTPHPQRRRTSSGGQPQELLEEEEMKLLAPSREEMQLWLEALRGEVEASERQGQTLFNTAWSLLRSYIDRDPEGDEAEEVDERETASTAAADSAADFVHVDGSGEGLGGGGGEEDLALVGGYETTTTTTDAHHHQHQQQQQQASSRRSSRPLPTHGYAADVSFVPPSVPIPRMNVVMMVVGTRGDVQPFLALGQLLRAHGHRVRLATHAMYRPLVVEEAGLEFYPLGGDPMKLSAYMVKTSGRIFPKLYDHTEMMKDVPEQRAMLAEIILSTWPACTAPDPADALQRSFLADAIISNPPAYGHVHCAEALNIPLHIMFPQPWSPTKAFPHPLSGLPYHGRWCKENYYSYLVVDKFLWLGIRDIVNELRVSQLGLAPLRIGEHGGDLLNHHRVPFAKMWSSCLVPKPKDWGPHIDVVGHFFGPETTGTPPGAEALEAWLEQTQFFTHAHTHTQGQGLGKKRPAPIFVGFGSMVIPDARSLVAMILEAARLTGTRVILQSSWTQLLPVEEQQGSNTHTHTTPPPTASMAASGLSEDVFSIGNCPHDWLLKRCSAVIHHGGSGTVAAGLRAGKPTMVCPFFGDQFFWGEMVFQAQVGVRPIPVVQLTAEKLAAAFVDLQSPALVVAAERLGARLAQEEGAKEGLKAFYRHLPVEDMVCDVSLFLEKPRLARKYCTTCGLKLSLEAHVAIHLQCDQEGEGGGGQKHTQTHTHHEVHDYSAMNWGHGCSGISSSTTSTTISSGNSNNSSGGGGGSGDAAGTGEGGDSLTTAAAADAPPRGATEGLVQGLNAFTHEFIGSMAGVVLEPVVGAQKTGVRGAARGLASGLVNLIRRPIRGGFILVDKVTAGVSNQLQGGGGGGGGGGHDGSSTGEGSSKKGGVGEEYVLLDPALAAELRAAHAQALRCKEQFLRLSKGDPCCVPKEGVLGLLEDLGGGFPFGEQQQQTKVLSRALLDRIDAVGAGQISFQQFCVFFKALRQGLQQEKEGGGGGGGGGVEGEEKEETTTTSATAAAAGAAAPLREESAHQNEEEDENDEEEGDGEGGNSCSSRSKMLETLIFDTIFLEDRATPLEFAPSVAMSSGDDDGEEGSGGKGEVDVHVHADVDVDDDRRSVGSSSSSSSSGTMEDIEIELDLAGGGGGRGGGGQGRRGKQQQEQQQQQQQQQQQTQGQEEKKKKKREKEGDEEEEEGEEEGGGQGNPMATSAALFAVVR